MVMGRGGQWGEGFAGGHGFKVSSNGVHCL